MNQQGIVLVPLVYLLVDRVVYGIFTFNQESLTASSDFQ
jgi:hypothetical protein